MLCNLTWSSIIQFEHNIEHNSSKWNPNKK